LGLIAFNWMGCCYLLLVWNRNHSFVLPAEYPPGGCKCWKFHLDLWSTEHSLQAPWNEPKQCECFFVGQDILILRTCLAKRETLSKVGHEFYLKKYKVKIIIKFREKMQNNFTLKDCHIQCRSLWSSSFCHWWLWRL